MTAVLLEDWVQVIDHLIISEATLNPNFFCQLFVISLTLQEKIKWWSMDDE